jgi:hypothetical protein
MQLFEPKPIGQGEGGAGDKPIRKRFEFKEERDPHINFKNDAPHLCGIPH